MICDYDGVYQLEVFRHQEPVMVPSQVDSHREFPTRTEYQEFRNVFAEGISMAMLLLVSTGICALTDIRDGQIYNCIVVPSAAAGLLLQGLTICGGTQEQFLAALLRMCGMLVFLLPFWLLLPGGIGGGDIKLYAAIAVMLEWDALRILIFLSLFLAGAYGLLRKGSGRNLRIGPAVFCAAILYAGGIYG